MADLPSMVAEIGADPRIWRLRAAEATLRLTAGGAPLSGAEVSVAQRSHAFGFGCTGFEFLPPAGGGQPDAERAALWLDLFNTATLPFYWGWFEPERGRPDTARLRAAAAGLTGHGVRVKGHPLAWHTETAPWLLELPDDEILRAQVDRIHREVGGFAGLIDTWDVINEAVIMPIFDRYDNGLTRVCRRLGRIPLIRAVFEAAREANPEATLLLNDFDMSAAYECLIEGVLEAGIRVDALGLQSHMHQGYWGEARTAEVLDRFSRYGLPLHFTETTLVSGHLMPPEIVDLNDYRTERWPTTPDGELRQAGEVLRHYRTLLSHPAVESVTYWGLTDGGWLGAPGGFVRADGTPKPSYEALHALVKGAWWLPPTTLVADAEGKVRLRGFLGEYAVTAGPGTARFTLDRPGEVTLDLAL